MKNKGLNRMLIPVVALLWLYLLFRFVSFTQIPAPKMEISTMPEINFHHTTDTLLSPLSLDYPDPFGLSNQRRIPIRDKVKVIGNQQDTAYLAEVKEELTMEWKGCVLSGKKPIALIQLPNKLLAAQVGDTIGEKILVGISEESLAFHVDGNTEYLELAE